MASNVCLDACNNQYITIGDGSNGADAPKPGMLIGVTSKSIHGVIVEDGAKAGDEAYFFADEIGKSVIREDAKLIITPPPAVLAINITDVPSEATMRIPLTLTGTVVPSGATFRTIAWSVVSAGTTGAYISGGNVLNTTAAGTVTVRATIANGVACIPDYTQDFTITVSSAVYTVTFTDGLGNDIGTPQNINHGAAAVAPDDPTRIGYIFAGWDKTFTNVTGDLTVNATWTTITYTVTFFDGFGNTIGTPQIIDHGTDAVPPEPIRDTHNFTGWDGDYTNVTSARTITAQWAIKTYTVTFTDGFGSTIGTPQTIEHGEDAAVPGDPIRTGYIFAGWDEVFTNITSDLTVTAQWTIITYTVTFLDDLGNELKVDIVDHGSSAVPPDDPIRETHNFTGWDIDFTDVTEDLTVTALWEIKTYSVTFVDGFGNTIGTPQIINHGEDAAVPGDPLRIGHIFAGWDKKFTNVTGNVTVTAQWLPYILTADDLIYILAAVTYSGAPQPIPTPTGANGITGIGTITIMYNGQTSIPINAGTYTVTADIAQGENFRAVTGLVLGDFKINPKPLPSDALSLPDGILVYTGFGITPEITVTDGSKVLVQDVDYTVVYADNVSVGEAASVTVAGIGNYAGEVTEAFEIVRGRGAMLFAGPNLVRKGGAVDFFWQGHNFGSGVLRVYDNIGNLVNTIKVKDDVFHNFDKRKIGSWNLTNRNGRFVARGTYVIRGTLTTADGKKEAVSLVIGVM